VLLQEAHAWIVRNACVYCRRGNESSLETDSVVGSFVCVHGRREMSRPVKLELKAIKYSESLSRETYAFTAKLYVNGKKYADVENNGGGGPNLIHTVKRDLMLDAAVMEKAYNELKADGDDSVVEVMHSWTSNAVTNHLIRKDMKAEFRKSIVFRKTPDDVLMSWPRPGGKRKLSVEQCVTVMRKTYPEMVTLNDMPEDEAFAAFKSL